MEENLEQINQELSKETVADAVETPQEVIQEVAETVEAPQEAAAETVVKKETSGEAIVVKKTIEEEQADYKPEIVEIDLGDDANLATAHDDFDWDRGAKNELNYTQSEFDEMFKQYESELNFINENEIVKGKISHINEKTGIVLLDLNYKSDGMLSVSELRGNEVVIGGEVEVYVESREDGKGQLVLSRRKAKLLRTWEAIVRSFEEGTTIEGVIVNKTKGGLIVDAGGLETFLPGSQIDIKPVVDYDAYVGKKMEFKVVKVNEAIKNAVVSHKALIESDLEEQRQKIIADLEKGQVLEGTVKNITDFGAFLDLGGVDGLLYITDISWGRITHPSEVLKINDKINVVVLDFDDNKKRISLGLKQLQPHPWEVLSETIAEGSTVTGKIVNIEDYGAFLEVQPGVEGLIHVSEVSWSSQMVNAKEHFKLGHNYEAKVVTIDREDRKMSLSLKQLTTDPWDEIETLFPIGSRHTGLVKNLTPYGVFIELQEGIGGMVHISDLSWTKRYSHPSEYVKKGQNIDITIEEIDKQSRKLSLGHKQLEENPWDTFETVFPVGSYHEATVLRVDDRGSIVQLPYGLEAFAPKKHMKKEDNTYAKTEEIVYVKVLEFNRDDKRILVSHSRYLEDQRREGEETERAEKVKEKEKVRKTIKKQNSQVERETLGDLDVFDALKQQMEEDAKPAAEPKKKKEKAAEPKKEEKAAEEPKVEAPKPEEVADAKAEDADADKDA